MVKMKKRKKTKILAMGILMAFTIGAMAGCGSSSNGLDEQTALQTADGSSVSRSLFQWYLIRARDQAYTFYPDSEDIWAEKIEEKKAKTWVEDKAVSYAKRHLFLEEETAERNLELSEEQKTELDDNLETYWNASGYERYYQDYGVDEAAFRQVLEEEQLENLLFEDQSSGLQKQVTDDVRKEYYDEHCVGLKYIAVPFPTTEEDSINADEKNENRAEEADTTELYESLKEKALAAGSLDQLIEKVSEDKEALQIGCGTSKSESGMCSMFYEGSTGISETFLKLLKEKEDGMVDVYQDDANQYWIIYEKVYLPDTQEYKEQEEKLTELCVQEQFSKWLDEQAETLEVTENEKITRSQDLKELFGE